MPAKKLTKRPSKSAKPSRTRPATPAPEAPASPATTTPFLAGAQRIGALLCRDAVWSNGRCNWLTWALDPSAGFALHYRASSRCLYDGTAGIALFLAELQRFAPEPEVKATAEGAGDLLLEYVAKASEREDHSLYAGLMGIALVLVKMGESLGREDYLSTGLKLAEKAGGSSAHPMMTDVLCGNAGMIVPLASLAEQYKKPRLMELAHAHAKRLAASATRSDRGASWAGPDPSMSHLLGYSHGNAGVALSLLELDHLSSDPAARELAEQALAYERSFFNPTLENWPDLRQMDGVPAGQPSYPVAWCHGATGIGLARTRLLQLRPNDAVVASEMGAAVNTAARFLASPRDPSASDYSYCHGLSASAELLLDAGLLTKRQDLIEAAQTTGRYGLDNHASSGWPCGVRGGPEVPGFMMGTAGIGWFMLRLHAPEQVDSMLVIRPKG